MSPFDAYFARLREYEAALEARGTEAWIWSECMLDRPAEAAASELILKENTAVELGGPRSIGTSFAVWTEDSSLVFDGRITLLGRDIPHLQGPGTPALPFGQVTLVGGPSLSSRIQVELERGSHLGGALRGYVVRGAGNRIWSRVSREACAAGLSFRKIGTQILKQIRGRIEAVSAAEIMFVTSSYEDVTELERIGSQVRKISHDLRRQRLREVAEGVYECYADVSCDVCPENPVCTEIRQIIVVRKKGARQESG
jgi:CO dehydrogenase/acetyl-CoA synthase beta subunit